MKTCPFCQSANADTLTYCRSCGKPLAADLLPATDPISVLEKRIASLESEINRISGEVNRANAFSAGALERGKRIPDSNIVSDSFLKRAFAVWGHNFVAQLIISIPIYILYFILMFALEMSQY